MVSDFAVKLEVDCTLAKSLGDTCAIEKKNEDSASLPERCGWRAVVGLTAPGANSLELQALATAHCDLNRSCKLIR